MGKSEDQMNDPRGELLRDMILQSEKERDMILAKRKKEKEEAAEKEEDKK